MCRMCEYSCRVSWKQETLLNLVCVAHTKFSTAILNLVRLYQSNQDDGTSSVPHVIPLDLNFNFILCTGYHS